MLRLLHGNIAMIWYGVGMKAMGIVWCLMMVGGGVWTGLGETVTHGVPFRVWSITRDAMDYVFMAATPGAGGRMTLAFNHRNGDTRFLKVGDRLGAWRIVEHRPDTREVRNPRTGLVKQVDAGTVILEREAGERRALKQGRLFVVDGYRAQLVDLRNGRHHDVRGGDRIESGRGIWRIQTVRTNRVMVSATETAVTQAVPLIKETDVAMLQQRAEAAAAQAQHAAAWERKQAVRREAEAWAQNVRIAPKKPPPPVATFDDEQRVFFGTEGPLPVEYTVVPPLFDNTGRMIRSAIVVPTQFETHPVCGFGNGRFPRYRGVRVRSRR